MTYRSRLSAAVGVLAAVGATAGATAAATSHARFWETPNLRVDCGVKIHPGTGATWVLCGARGIPPAVNGGGAGDPFVQIARTGSAHLVSIGQNSFEGSPVTLHARATWISLGVTCKVGAVTTTCRNQSGHGFTIGGRYRSF